MSNLCSKCLTRIDEGRMYCKDCDDSARGMFEELGYQLYKNDDEEIVYNNGENYIEFMKDQKIVKSYSLKWFGINPIDIKTLTSINKQVEELGWLDE